MPAVQGTPRRIRYVFAGIAPKYDRRSAASPGGARVVRIRDFSEPLPVSSKTKEAFLIQSWGNACIAFGNGRIPVCIRARNNRESNTADRLFDFLFILFPIFTLTQTVNYTVNNIYLW